jgi:hypothetical protein
VDQAGRLLDAHDHGFGVRERLLEDGAQRDGATLTATAGAPPWASKLVIIAWYAGPSADA